MPRYPALLSTIPVVLCGCNKEDDDRTPRTTDRDEVHTSATRVDDIKDQPSQYAGKKVRVSGEVDRVFGARAFELEGDGMLFDEQILVVTRSPVHLAGQALEDDDEVVVEGTVRVLTVTEIERELGWDLDREIEIEYDKRPFVIADSIERVEETARWSESESREGMLVGLVTIFAVPDPAALAGSKIHLDDVVVRSKAERGAWVGYSHGAQVFVAPATANAFESIEVGASVEIDGTLRAMPPAKEAVDRFGIAPTLSTQVAEEPLYVDAARVEKSKS